MASNISMWKCWGSPGTGMGQTGRGRDTGYYTILLTTRFHTKRRRTVTTNDSEIMRTKDDR